MTCFKPYSVIPFGRWCSCSGTLGVENLSLHTLFGLLRLLLTLLFIKLSFMFEVVHKMGSFTGIVNAWLLEFHNKAVALKISMGRGEGGGGSKSNLISRVERSRRN